MHIVCGAEKIPQLLAENARNPRAITLFATGLAGMPVSTSHTITGAIVGVGAVQRLSAVGRVSQAALCGPGFSRSRSRAHGRLCLRRQYACFGQGIEERC